MAWKNHFDVTVDEGEESEEERSSGEFMDSEEEAEVAAAELNRYLAEQAERARARRAVREQREKLSQEEMERDPFAGDDGKPRQRKKAGSVPQEEKTLEEELEEYKRRKEEEKRERQRNRIPKGYEEVSEEEYIRRMKKMERAAAFLGFGPVGFFCFIYIVMMGVIFVFLYLGIYMRDPKFFVPFNHNLGHLMLR